MSRSSIATKIFTGKDVDSAKEKEQAISLSFKKPQLKNIAQKSDKFNMNVSKKKKRLPRSIRNKRIKVGKWNKSLKVSDVNQIWTELHRIVSSHPLARASRKAGFLVEEGKYNAYTDLTQELFVTLLSKERFQHYLDTKMTDAEIEGEISQIELTNLLTAELRKRYPESYRLARRVSTLVQKSETFKRFDNVDNPEHHRRLVNRLYGLASWKIDKSSRDGQEMRERVKRVAFYNRDTRMVGCTGDSQIVISNPELEKLIVKVLKAIDSPIDVRSLRSFVMSRLPIMDIYLVPVGGTKDDDDGNKMSWELSDTRETPEEDVLRREAELIAVGFVENFLKELSKSVRGKAKQYERMLNVLWLCYLVSDSGTQLEVADTLGVSDSLVSDYRKRIESNLQDLSFDGVNEARHFEKALKAHVRTLVTIEKDQIPA